MVRVPQDAKRARSGGGWPALGNAALGLALSRNSSGKNHRASCSRPTDCQLNELIEWSALSLLQIPLDFFRRPVPVCFDHAYLGPVSLVHKSV
jgi:hypothetical protein